VSLLSDAITWWLAHIGGPTIQTNIIDPINAWADGVDAALADSGDVTSGIFTGANGCTVTGSGTTQRGRIIGNTAIVRCTYKLGSAAATALGAPSGGGALTDTPVLDIADARFVTASGFADQALISGSAGRPGGHVVTSNQIELCWCVGSTPASGDTFSFTGAYRLD
jgi:hypothetical protein